MCALKAVAEQIQLPGARVTRSAEQTKARRNSTAAPALLSTSRSSAWAELSVDSLSEAGGAPASPCSPRMGATMPWGVWVKAVGGAAVPLEALLLEIRVSSRWRVARRALMLWAAFASSTCR